MRSPIKNFTDLDAWKHSHDLRIGVLKEISAYPAAYQYGLCSQMQRSAISIGSNLAEGFGRYNEKERIQFYRIARASLVELHDQLIVARDMQLMPNGKFDSLMSRLTTTHKLINGLIRTTPNMFLNSKLKGPASNVKA